MYPRKLLALKLNGSKSHLLVWKPQNNEKINLQLT